MEEFKQQTIRHNDRRSQTSREKLDCRRIRKERIRQTSNVPYVLHDKDIRKTDGRIYLPLYMAGILTR